MHPNQQSDYAPTSTSIDDSDTGWKIFVGYQFNRNFAIEVNYAELSTFTLNADITMLGIGTLRDTLEPEAGCISGVVAEFYQRDKPERLC